ncbi:phosphotransferase family enzyme [Archangium gephyra]|uniref:Phosphotransferase family enzyme n=1 Tax=Archangium gephyra TaxID=48 RepID=A0AAC8TH24_9BACT|nr:phosphotransferase [Archangium gephyra]AKJ05792.1 Hypothetical protein AA314_07418 [Archangium gephyra]REG36468.1 phosphotransferase family enzyme [Archangium gephyra]
MLSVDTAVPYLLERGLISAQALIDGDLTITSAARRNRNLRVAGSGGGYLIKQPDASAFGAEQTLRAEVAFYSFCEQEPAVAAMRALLPRLKYFDPERSLLALELLENPQPLWTHYASRDVARFPFQTARAVGQALGVFHRTFRLPGPAEDPRLSWMSRQLPWVMRVHKPGPEMLSTLSPANYQTLRILQTQEQLSQNLDRLRKLWTPVTLIHNDIKSDNVLVLPPREGPEGAPEVRLVDWELVQVGDPAWDIAGALQDMVLFWVASMPVGAPLTPEQLVASARYPLPVLQQALRALWQGYRVAAGLDAAEASALLARAVPYSAARLIQSAYESAHTSNALPATSVLMLQISANLLNDPRASQVQLYGLVQGLV